MKKKTNYTRRRFIASSLATGFAVSLQLYSCTKSNASPDGKPDDGSIDDPNKGKLKISGVSLPTAIESNKGAELIILGRGFVTDDQILLESLSNASKAKYVIASKSVTETSVSFLLPQDIVSDKYRVSIKRGERVAVLGTTALHIYFNASIPNRVGMTVKGTVYAGGVGLANVVVSDGFEVTSTDANGIYYLPSAKKGKYVFISIPGNYEVETNSNIPQFFQRLTQSASTVEIKDFELKPVHNDNHVVMVLGDMHLAKRTDDLNQFRKGFMPDVNQSIQSYRNAGNKVYALTLGDMTWDGYWYTNNYGLPHYLTEINKMDAMVFHTMGNHDNDPNFATDWGAEDKFRDIIGPTYYSFNLGKIHYIVLDNIEYLNTNSERNYHSKIIEHQIEWLKKDLASIADKNTPIVVAMHIHLHTNPSLNNSGHETTGYRISNAAAFIEALNGFKTVHLVTGHTHINYNVETASTPHIMEHNTAAVCATWWWTGNIGYAGNHICISGYPLNSGVYNMYANREMRFYASIGFNEAVWQAASSQSPTNHTAKYYYQDVDGRGGVTAASPNYPITGYVIKKYNHAMDAFQGTGARHMEKAYPIIRYAEILLSYAEALNNLTGSHSVQVGEEQYTVSRNVEEIKTAFNLVRYRAGLPGLAANQLATADIQKQIERERMVEFLYENRRFYDVRRWGIYEQTEREPIRGMNPDGATKETYYQRVIPGTSSFLKREVNKRSVWVPIPRAEMRRLPSLDQNPGY